MFYLLILVIVQKLVEAAEEILHLNDRDGFTIPSAKLYPFQWNWDSGFVSLGWAHIHLPKAIEELKSLFTGQWKNGMLPHIIFHSQNEKTYFPNFDFWKSEVNPGSPILPKTSGITQPAVQGFILEELINQFPDSQELLDFAEEIFPKIVNNHRFLYDCRDPEREGLMFTYHPWESGRDNSPIWDIPMSRIEIKEGDIPTYQRKDTSISKREERPTRDKYDRYVYLLLLGQKFGYDGSGIYQESPLLVQDCMVNAILIKSNRSLIEIGKRLGLDIGQIVEWQSQSLASFESKFWNEDLSMYVSFDMRDNAQIKLKEIGGLTPLFARIPSQKQASIMRDYLNKLHERDYYLCPSFDVDNLLFDSKRYWRGPIWPHMNWMIYKGLLQYDFNRLAEIVRKDTLELISKYGFYEYFESRKEVAAELSHGYGGDLFSWTASTIIDLIKRG